MRCYSQRWLLNIYFHTKANPYSAPKTNTKVPHSLIFVIGVISYKNETKLWGILTFTKVRLWYYFYTVYRNYPCWGDHNPILIFTKVLFVFVFGAL